MELEIEEKLEVYRKILDLMIDGKKYKEIKLKKEMKN